MATFVFVTVSTADLQKKKKKNEMRSVYMWHFMTGDDDLGSTASSDESDHLGRRVRL